MIPEPVNNDTWTDFLRLYHRLKGEKPLERSEQARRYAVCITEFEKVMAFYLIFCENGNFTGEIHSE
jgi:hypothetical protein